MIVMLLEWTLDDAIVGWATCVVASEDVRVVVYASDARAGPEPFLGAVTRIVTGEHSARVDFEAEPITYRWILDRVDEDRVCIRLVRLDDYLMDDALGVELWTDRPLVAEFGETVLRCFDLVATTYGDGSYRERWTRPFPHPQVERLRAALANKPID